jgi:microcystin degradation protein MlrC
MKFVIAMMQHETNTFSPLATPYEAFAGATGQPSPPAGEDALVAYSGTNFPFAAFVDLAQAQGADFVVPIAANAEPSGPVADRAFEAMAGRICEAVAAGCDAVLLDLHGAMVTESSDDGEGELLRRIRRVAPDTPVAVALDFHTNLTAAMVENATVITGYRTYPHVDMYETGERAGRTLLRALNGEAAPRMAWGALPMMTHMILQTPARQPMKDVMDQAIAAEAEGQVLNASVFGGFPLADIPHVSLSALVVSDGPDPAAETLLRDMLGLAWQRRAEFVFAPETLEDSIAFAKTLGDGPVVLADHGDNCGAGGQSDNMAVLREALQQGLTDLVAGPVWDPEAVEVLFEAGLGAEVSLPVGGKSDAPAMELKGAPLELSGRVAALTDGTFTITGPMMTGFTVTIGRTAVVDTGPAQVVISSHRCEPYDLGVFSHAGIDPTKKKYILIKSRQHFRAGFEPIAKHIVLVAGPGVCSSDYGAFPFRKLRRPIYPLDPLDDSAGPEIHD